MGKANSYQLSQLHPVLQRREEKARCLLKDAGKQLDSAKTVVHKHQQHFDQLQSETKKRTFSKFDVTLTEIVQRERLLYWLNYDTENVAHMLGNAKDTLAEKQANYDLALAALIKVHKRNEKMLSYESQLKSKNRLHQERLELEAWEDSGTSHYA